MKGKYSILISILLCAAIICTLIPIAVFASDVDSEWPSWAELGSASRTLSGGSYKITSNTGINGGSGSAGLTISGTVRIYIASGVTLTVTGGDAGYGAQGGGAGINLPSGATLKIYGAGRLVANGGDGGWVTAGSSGSGSYVSGTTVYLGRGGNGGNGAGAPGSGIGGNGGTGGTAGKGGSSYSYTVHSSCYGNSGSSGCAGNSGGSMGTLYVYDAVAVTATAGSKSSTVGYGGSNGSCSYVIIDNCTRAYAGGAGGGGGGQSNTSANVGGAGGGGGGGGGGASAGYVWNEVYLGGGGGGGGGGTGTSGYGGTAGDCGDYYPSSSSAGLSYSSASGSSGGTFGGSGGRSSYGYARNGSTYWYGGGGSGDSGGALGSTGGNGTVYCETTASINGASGVTAIYRLTFNDQGGTGGSVSVSGISGTNLPSSVSVPTRTGYTFGGYWTGNNGTGTQYYNTSGQRVGTITYSSSRAIFAGWTAKTSTLSVNPNGGTISGSTNTKTYTQGYNTTLTVPASTRNGYAFMGWKYTKGTAGGSDVQSSFSGGSNMFTFGTVNATLEAIWMTAQNTEYDLPEGVSGADLDNTYNKLVGDTEYGVTQGDIADDQAVTLTLSVTEKSAGAATNADKIQAAAKGSVMQYYDIAVTKTVTTASGSESTTLKEIPEDVKITLSIPESLRGKTSYAIYRYHDYGGGSSTTAEVLSSDPGAEEYYVVNTASNTIEIYTKRFSTYALAASEASITPTTEEVISGDASSGIDVQGKMVDGYGAVYKLDITWGTMTFDFNATSKIWDPVDHTYMDGGEQGWSNANFTNGNNQITITNHSNADVKLDFVATPNNALDGVTMAVNSTNSLSGTLAQNIVLNKVPAEYGDAQQVSVYVWLTGTPTNLSLFKNDSYTKAGVITVCAAAQDGTLTPKN